MKSKISKLLVVGVAILGTGAFALAAFANKANSEAARSERATLGVITFIGFGMTSIGGFRTFRARRNVKDNVKEASRLP